MDKIRHDVVYLYLVPHIKQYLKEFNCSFFDLKTDEVDTALKKYERGEELTPEELLALAEHIVADDFKKNFKDGVLDHDSIILPYDKRWLFNELDKSLNNHGIRLLYESYYVMKLLDEVHSKINRALSLRKVLIIDQPSIEVKEYCKEAYFCYLDGRFNASIILLRAIIEQALKDKFNLKIDFGTLGAIRNYLSNNSLISDELRKKITKIVDAGNKAVHTMNKQASESNNKYLIEVAQDILHSLFN